MKMGYLYLGIAVAAEVIATSALKASDGFTRPLPTVIVALGYGVAFYFLSLVLKTVPVGVAYAIWSGAGIVLIGLIGWLVLKQPLDVPAMLGMGLIIAGVAVIQLFSRTATAEERPHGRDACCRNAWETQQHRGQGPLLRQ